MMPKQSEPDHIEEFRLKLIENGLTEEQSREYMATIELICVEHINALLRKKGIIKY